MICHRCGKEITEMHMSQYFNAVYGPYWRSGLAYAKLNIWQPEQRKSEKAQMVVLCASCYEEFVNFLEV